jgi:hypothetical protein
MGLYWHFFFVVTKMTRDSKLYIYIYIYITNCISSEVYNIHLVHLKEIQFMCILTVSSVGQCEANEFALQSLVSLVCISNPVRILQVVFRLKPMDGQADGHNLPLSHS